MCRPLAPIGLKIGWSGAFWTKFNGVEGQVFPPAMASYVAVKLYGPGHVVAYNYITDFHDDINVETYGNPDGSSASGPGILDGPHYPTREYWDRRPVDDRPPDLLFKSSQETRRSGVVSVPLLAS